MDLKVGIVGFGLRASLHRYVQRPGQGSVVSIVCDTSERGRADARKALPESVVTDDLQELLDSGIDAVLVLTPDHTHRDVVVRTLQAGIPTFCEKPLDISTQAADEILQTAYRTGTRLYVGHNMRHMPVIRQLKQLIDEGAIGQVKAVWCRHFVGNGGDYYFKDWHAERRYSNTLLLQKGAHDIDVIHWLAGGYSTEVSGLGGLTVYGDVSDRRDNSDRRMGDWFSKENWPPTAQKDLNPTIDVEDLSMVQMKLDNGVFAPTSSATSLRTTGATTQSLAPKDASRTSATGPANRSTSGTRAAPAVLPNRTGRSPSKETRKATAGPIRG